MQGNSGKYKLILRAGKPVEMQAEESPNKIKSCKRVLGVKIDVKLTFDKYIKAELNLT